MSPAPRPSLRTGFVRTAAAGLVLVALSACSTPPWELESTPAPQPAGSASGPASPAPSSAAPGGGSSSTAPSGSAAPSGSTGAAPSGSASAAPTDGGSASSSSSAAGRPNDLARGSVRRTVTAGEARLIIDYWSTLSIDQWTPEIPKPLSMAVVASLPNTPAGRGVFLTRVTMTPVAQVDQTVLGTVPTQEDQATVEPGYDVLAPRSYQQVFVLPGVDPTATSMTVTLTYELLVETTADSEQYAKQTGQDTITIALN